MSGNRMGWIWNQREDGKVVGVHPWRAPKYLGEAGQRHKAPRPVMLVARLGAKFGGIPCRWRLVITGDGRGAVSIMKMSPSPLADRPGMPDDKSSR